MEKKEGLLFLSLFLLAILIVSVSALTTCYVTSRSSCLESQGNDIILGLSDSTNAHAEEKGYDDENVCYGTATACTNLYSESSCTTQEGCSWNNFGTEVGGDNPNLFLALTGNIINGVSGYCTNDPGATACPTYTGSGNQLECENQRGCSWEIEYNSVLCCNSDSEIVPAECTAGKYLLQLSSATNAHTEGNDIGTYSIDVCSKHKNENANCVASNINPENPGWSSVLSLSGLTNAHVGGPGELEYDLWCPLNYDDSILPEFYCGDEAIQRPNSLGLDEECEESLGSANCDYGNCLCIDGYEYSLLTQDCQIIAAAVGVYWAYPLDSQNPISGGIDWNNEIISSGSAYPIQVGTSTVWLAFRSTGYGSGTSVEFNIYDKDLFSGDDLIKTLIGVVDDNGDVSVDWTITQYDLEATGDNNLEDFSGIGDGFYFKAEHPTEGTQTSEDLKATVTGAIVCDAITMCMDYRTQNRCDNDALFCNVAAYSVNQNSPGTDCSDPDIGCSCTWTTGDIDECNSYWGVVDENGFAVGGCTYNQDSSDTCADNFLEYSWTGDWGWDTSEGNVGLTHGQCEAIHPGECTEFDGLYYYDPGFKSLECTAGSNVVPCPAKIQLSFFNTYNLIITLVLIIIIYLIVISNTRKGTRKKTKTKSRKKK